MRKPILSPYVWTDPETWHSLPKEVRDDGLSTGDSIPQPHGEPILIEALDYERCRIRARGESGRLRWFKPHELNCSFSVPSIPTFIIGGSYAQRA